MAIDLAAVRASIAAREPTPLLTYLLIYHKAQRECYINYMEGAKLLHQHLAPLDFQISKYPEIADKDRKIPCLLSSYHTAELAGIIATQNNLGGIAYARRAITFTVLHNLELFT